MAEAIEVEGLARRFGDVQAVSDLRFSVAKGEIFGFLGPNGAGKTTSLRMMTGLLRPSAGTVRYFGRDVATDHDVIRDHLGVLFQENVLWADLTALETLRFLAEMHGLPRADGRARAATLLDLFGLAEKANKRAGTMSGGQQRRLAIATSLIHDPDVLLLDEPEAGLDPQSRLSVRETIRAVGETKTVVLTTHNMDEADRLCDRIAVIDHGSLIALDTPSRLKATLGEGDVLEVEVEGDPTAAAKKIQRLKFGKVNVVDQHLVVHGHDLARRFPEILKAAKAGGVTVRGTRYRENTLEDVFIHLTGRGLRE